MNTIVVAAWIAAQLVLVVAAVQLMARPPLRQLASILALAAALLSPFLMPDIPLLRAVLSALSLLALVKVVQVAKAPERWSGRDRLWHALAPFDTAGTQRVAPMLERRLLLSILGYAVLALLALLALLYLPRGPSFWATLARILLGAGLVYCGMEVVVETVRLLHRLGGVAVPPIQRAPILSLSLREFWGERWNLSVSGWLGEFVFTPMARRHGPAAAVMATFGVSGLLHGWLFLVAAGPLMGLMALFFFLFHGWFVLMESRSRLRFQPASLRRSWTLGMLLLSSPLFVEPTLRVLLSPFGNQV